MINELVCEGCGDCGVQSNCLSVEPLETEFGRKRTINQNTCNKDTSCLKGFCPSFVSIEGGQLKKKSKLQKFSLDALPSLPLPLIPDLSNASQAYGIVVAGVGGTGVITIGQLLGMAAHLDGLGIVTQDSAGLAQKGGATWSHVLLAKDQTQIQTTRVSMAAADLILGCDPIVSAGKETLSRMLQGRTHVALNSYSTPTAAFVKNTQWLNPADSCAAEIANTPFGRGEQVNMTALATWLAAESKGMKFNLSQANQAEKTFYEVGKRLFFQRGGPHDFACASCHAEDGKRIRLQDLPNLTKNAGDGIGVAAWPAYRVSNGQMWGMQQRLNDCYRQQRFPFPGFASDATIALGVYLGVNSQGSVSIAPAIKR
jgi:sulfur oxidation c-type cytochrome SoxA